MIKCILSEVHLGSELLTKFCHLRHSHRVEHRLPSSLPAPAEPAPLSQHRCAAAATRAAGPRRLRRGRRRAEEPHRTARGAAAAAATHLPPAARLRGRGGGDLACGDAEGDGELRFADPPRGAEPSARTAGRGSRGPGAARARGPARGRPPATAEAGRASQAESRTQGRERTRRRRRGGRRFESGRLRQATRGAAQGQAVHAPSTHGGPGAPRDGRPRAGCGGRLRHTARPRQRRGHLQPGRRAAAGLRHRVAAGASRARTQADGQARPRGALVPRARGAPLRALPAAPSSHCELPPLPHPYRTAPRGYQAAARGKLGAEGALPTFSLPTLPAHPPCPPRVQVRLTFEVELLSKGSWTGELLAPHAPLLLEAMQGQAMDPAPTEDLGQGLRQGLVRALARLSEAALAPHVALLRGVMEREHAQKVQLEMIRLPAPILSQCSAVSWLADVLPK